MATVERFQDNAAAFTEAFGVKHAPLVVWLSMIPWRSADERSEFIRVTTGRRQSRAATEQPKFPSRL
jgi:hypothetical protein